MIFRPALDQAKEIAQGGDYKILPLTCEIYSDKITPIELLHRLKKISKKTFMLESVEDGQKWSRHTFLGFDPRLELSCTDETVIVRTPSSVRYDIGNPNTFIRKILEENHSPHFDYLPPFTGGLVGYFSYDYLKYAESSIVLKAKNPEDFKDLNLMLFDKLIVFDNLAQKIILIVNISCQDLPADYERGKLELEKLKRLIQEDEPASQFQGRMTSGFRSLYDKEKFCQMVDEAKEYISRGELGQVVLSNQLEADFEGSLLDTYRALRSLNPSPYMFYFSSPDLEIAGSSPETLIKLEEGQLYTYPLAGTRPRGQTPEEDKLLEAELLADQKECSEHKMLVDLGMQDMEKISQEASLKVEKYMNILRFSHVMHIGSALSGKIKKDLDALDALAAVLPAGTLSGSPKATACQLIDKLENNKRGVYGGAVGYMDFSGNMDTCIAIRMALKKNGKVLIRSGAGIVAGSIPEKEYEECINKAKAIVTALERAQEGLQ